MDCYEFYRLIDAATSLNNHDFGLPENLQCISPEQFEYVRRALLRCNSRAKMESLSVQIDAAKDRIAKELDKLHPFLSGEFAEAMDVVSLAG